MREETLKNSTPPIFRPAGFVAQLLAQNELLCLPTERNTQSIAARIARAPKAGITPDPDPAEAGIP